MTLGRWLLVHSFSIFLVVIFILGYIYREELKLELAYMQIMDLGKSETVVESLKRDNQPQPNNKQKNTEQKVGVTKEESPKLATTSTVDSAPLGAEPTILQTQGYQQDHLFDARAAYWQRDYLSAIEKYRNLIENEPDNPDYSGELGNIYYTMNDYKNASELYYRTARLLLDQGKREEAGQLLPPISAMNRELGGQLRHALKQ